jgi:two-component system osmolarity sensor histidine kinase EnvZ
MTRDYASTNPRFVRFSLNSLISPRFLMFRFLRHFNTIFGRLSLLSVALLVLMQLTWVVLVDHERGVTEAAHISRLIRLALDSPPSLDTPQFEDNLSATLGVHYESVAADAIPLTCPSPCRGGALPFEAELLANLPAGSRVVFDVSKRSVWVRYGLSRRWLLVPTNAPPLNRLLSATAAMLFLAIVIALLVAWQMQKPLNRLAKAAREFRLGHRAPVVRAAGPFEVKSLIGDFNEMAREFGVAEEERAVMLAGVAHDLRAPITRIQVRANLVQDERARVGFLNDTESLSQIVTQFLDFARDTEADPDVPWVSVDAFCGQHYTDADDAGADDEYEEYEAGAAPSMPGEPSRKPSDRPDRTTVQRESLFELDLHAGPGFRLPPIELDRILSNLIENAFTYGAPPLCIATARTPTHYRLSVRDHGTGMPEAQFNRAFTPFVRLDPARGGDAHCGLGLTIVRRLTRRYGGEISLRNAEGGGLIVSLDFPLRNTAK